MIRCGPVSPAPPAPPGPLVDNTLFQVTTEFEAAEEMAPLNVQITYAAASVPADQREKLTIGSFDAGTWKPLAEQTVEQAVSRVSGTLTKDGVYALYRRP